MKASTVAFDSVLLKSRGESRRLSVEAFLALPLDERVVHILQREVEFFSGEIPVDRDVALRSLRTASRE